MTFAEAGDECRSYRAVLDRGREPEKREAKDRRTDDRSNNRERHRIIFRAERSRSPGRRRHRSRDKGSQRSGRRRNLSGRHCDRSLSWDEERRVGRKPRSPDDVADRRSTQSLVKRDGPLPSQDETFAVNTGKEPEQLKETPNFGNSGVLAAASNSITQVDGSTIVLKYHEPPEARKPSARDQWKLFIFKEDAILDTIDLSLRSCWLVGREIAVVDLPTEHPSISKQHAVIQFRYIEKRNDYGDKIGKVKPYLIDLESANGTRLNKKKVPDSRYLELRDKDMIQFGFSSREYVLMLAPTV